MTSHFHGFEEQAPLLVTLDLIKATRHLGIRQLRQCLYLVLRPVHRSQAVVAPGCLAPRYKYLAAVAAEPAYVEVHIVPEGLLDHNQSYHRDLQLAAGGSEGPSAFAEIVAAAGIVEVVGDLDIVEAAAAAEIAGSEQCWLAVMRAGL